MTSVRTLEISLGHYMLLNRVCLKLAREWFVPAGNESDPKVGDIAFSLHQFVWNLSFSLMLYYTIHNIYYSQKLLFWCSCNLLLTAYKGFPRVLIGRSVSIPQFSLWTSKFIPLKWSKLFSVNKDFVCLLSPQEKTPPSSILSHISSLGLTFFPSLSLITFSMNEILWKV